MQLFVTSAYSHGQLPAYAMKKRRDEMSYYKQARIRTSETAHDAFSLLESDNHLPTSSSSGSLPFLGGLKQLNWKNMLEQMGGIDGLINRMNQMHKLLESVQKLSPVLKMLSSNLGRKGSSDSNDSQDDERELSGFARKRTRRRKIGAPRLRRKRRF